MKKSFIILSLLLIPYLFFAQEKDTTSFSKHSIFFEIGLNYNNAYNSENDILDTSKANTLVWRMAQLADIGYQTKSNITFHFGKIYNLRFKKHIAINTGLHYVYKKRTLISWEDTIKKYYPPYFTGNIDTLNGYPPVERYYYSNTIALPVFIEVYIKKFSIYTGVNINILNFEKSKFVYIDELKNTHNSFKLIPQKNNFGNADLLLGISYNISIYNIPIRLFSSLKFSDQYYTIGFGFRKAINNF